MAYGNGEAALLCDTNQLDGCSFTQRTMVDFILGEVLKWKFSSTERQGQRLVQQRHRLSFLGQFDQTCLLCNKVSWVDLVGIGDWDLACPEVTICYPKQMTGMVVL